MRNEGPRARGGQDRGTTSGCLPESRNITGKLRLHLNFHASLQVLVEFNLSAGAPKGAPACEAVPEVEGGGSGQAAEKKFGEAQILCIFSPISA